MKRSTAALLVLASALSVIPGEAAAYCLFPPTEWTTRTTVPVILHSNLQQFMLHPNGTQWTRSELIQSVNWVLARINGSTMADTPWFYLDAATGSTCDWTGSLCGAPACDVQNAIIIIPSNCAMAIDVARGVVFVQRSDPGPLGMRYGHFEGPNTIFEHDVMHELGHALGLGHPTGVDNLSGTTCGSPTAANWSTECPSGAVGCTNMLGPSPDTHQDYFALNDVDGLRARYGTRAQSGHTLFEFDGSGVLGLPHPSIDAMGFFVSSSEPGGPATPTRATIAGYSRTLRGIPVVFDWNWSSLATTSVGIAPFFVSTGPHGVAQDSTNRWSAVSTPRLTTDSARFRRRIAVSQRPQSGGSWTTSVSNPFSGTSADTVSPGLSSAFDPSANVVIHAFRDDNGVVILQSSNSAGEFSNAISTGFVSMAVPQIACGMPVVTRNCIAILVDPGVPASTATSQRLQWFEFDWIQAGTSANISATSLVTTGYLMHGDPSVAVRRINASSFEFDVFYMLPLTYLSGSVNSIYLLRKTNGASNAFTLWGEIAQFSGQTPFPAAGGCSNFAEGFVFPYAPVP